MVTLNTEEVDQMKADIAAGKLPPTAIEDHKKAEEKNVFGFDVKHKRGKPVEQGIGAPGNETENHFAALRQREAAGLEEPGTHKRLYGEWLARKAKERAEDE